MIGRIQRDARGLLNFLNVVGQTERPNALNDVVQGTMELMPFWGSALLQSRRLTGLIQNPGDTVVLDVPVGEAWYMLGVQYGVLAGLANEIVSCSAAALLPPDGTVIRLDSFESQKQSLAATSQLLKGYMFPQPFILVPGAQLIVVVDDSNLAAARTGAIAAVCYPFAV